MLDKALKSTRILIEVPLKPVQGDRFQPTGFADLGAATYELPDGTQMLLVETAQSMANRLEAACLGDDKVSLDASLEGLPYIHVKLTGDAQGQTSSLTEAHRINSPYIMNAEGFEKRFSEAVNYQKGKTVEWKRVASTLLHFDPGSLVHGVFMANFEDGRIRVPRALTSFIEARNVRAVASGGVKNNALDPSGTIRAVGTEKENVYGNVPYHRTEYVGDLTAYFNLDLALLKGHGLGDDATRLLTALSLYKIRRFLDGSMRLRTACDLMPKGPIVVKAPVGFELPEAEQLLDLVRTGIKLCAQKKLFADPAVTELTVKVKQVKKKDEEASDGAEAG